MFEILICEDNERERVFLTDFINGYIMMEDLDMKVMMSTPDPNVMIEYVKENASGGLYFLDVDLKAAMTGIQLAVQIRAADPKAAIVFITTHAELMSLTFEYAIEALGYIVKGDPEVMKEKVVKYIRHVAKREYGADESAEKFVAKVDNIIITEDYDQILTFEIAVKRQSKVVMYTKKRSVEINSTLAEIEKISDKFVRCHRSCVVNIDNIKSIDSVGRKVHLVTGGSCIASISGIKILKKLFES